MKVNNMNGNVLAFVIASWYFKVNCEKIVVLPLQTRSRVFPIFPVAREMEKYNHTVTFVFSPNLNTELIDSGERLTNITATGFDKIRSVDTIQAYFEKTLSGFTYRAMFDSAKHYYYQCHNFMQDEELNTKLKAEKFDYAIVSFSKSACLEVMAYKLGIPFVYIGAHIDYTLYRVPFFPSFMPSYFTGFTDKMSFTQRAFNIASYLLHLLYPTMPTVENLVAKYAPNRPYLTNCQLKRSALIHIVDSDVLMDFALPIPSNIILCGGLATRNSKKLAPYIEDFVYNFNGVVVVSFGSIINTIAKAVLDKFIQAFYELNQLGFIIRSGNTTRIHKNVLLSPWIPQNDLLGHGKTRLLITHCGKSGIFEALYHGVPMIGFPMGKDQFSNAAVIVDKGYGISMDIINFSVDELIENIKEVVYMKYYRANIQRASAIFHSRPQTPSQRAAYWIDLVTKYGAEHLRPSSLDMPWYSYYMLDICSVLFLIFFLIRHSKRLFKAFWTTLFLKNKVD